MNDAICAVSVPGLADVFSDRLGDLRMKNPGESVGLSGRSGWQEGLSSFEPWAPGGLAPSEAQGV